MISMISMMVMIDIMIWIMMVLTLNGSHDMKYDGDDDFRDRARSSQSVI